MIEWPLSIYHQIPQLLQIQILIQILMHHFQLICVISMTEYSRANHDALTDSLLHSNSSEVVVSGEAEPLHFRLEHIFPKYSHLT